jgi:hypothetical protein
MTEAEKEFIIQAIKLLTGVINKLKKLIKH